MKLRHTRLALPMALIGIGTYVLIGCIPLPGDYRNTDNGPRPEEQIGKEGDPRPLTLGRATLDAVSDVLGHQPMYKTLDGRIAAYRYHVRTGTILYPLCFMADTTTAHRFLVLHFDDAGGLKSFKVYKEIEQAPELRSFMDARRQRRMDPYK